jgi:hypothetical protein
VVKDTPGSHQFHCPNRRMRAGTRTSRTRVASRASAMASANPICWTAGELESTKLPNTATMIAAAALIGRAV